jgi:hypothetical protein
MIERIGTLLATKIVVHLAVRRNGDPQAKE